MRSFQQQKIPGRHTTEDGREKAVDSVVMLPPLILWKVASAKRGTTRQDAVNVRQNICLDKGGKLFMVIGRVIPHFTHLPDDRDFFASTLHVQKPEQGFFHGGGVGIVRLVQDINAMDVEPLPAPGERKEILQIIGRALYRTSDRKDASKDSEAVADPIIADGRKNAVDRFLIDQNLCRYLVFLE